MIDILIKQKQKGDGLPVCHLPHDQASEGIANMQGLQTLQLKF